MTSNFNIYSKEVVMTNNTVNVNCSLNYRSSSHKKFNSFIKKLDLNLLNMEGSNNNNLPEICLSQKRASTKIITNKIPKSNQTKITNLTNTIKKSYIPKNAKDPKQNLSDIFIKTIEEISNIKKTNSKVKDATILNSQNYIIYFLIKLIHVSQIKILL